MDLCIERMGPKHSVLFMINFLQKRPILVILSLIFLMGIFLRFYRLSEFPVGFHIDEAINGVNAYFILETGKDSNNNKFPLQTEVFGDYNPTGYSYLTILPIKLFGLNEFSTRLPGALLGGLTILASFLLAFSIFRNKTVSLLSAFLVAISPWHIVFSRSSEEALVSLFFVVFGFALVFLSLENKSIGYLTLGIISLALSFLMYFTPRIFVPLIFVLIIIYFFRTWYKQKNIKYKNFLIFSFLFLVAAALFLTFGLRGGENRFKQVSIFGSMETKLVMEEQIREDGVVGTSVFVARLLHNKFINYSLTYISNYIDYFSGNFLFIRGGLPIWLKTEGVGLIYLIELPFLLTGLVLLATNKNKMHKIPLLWLLIAPLVAAITTDDIPNMRRSLAMFPIIEIISAIGFFYILQNKKGLLKYSIFSVTAIFLILNFIYFTHQYFIHTKIHRTWYRNNGAKSMINTIEKSYNDYDKIIVTKSTGGIYPLILFYMKMDPRIYQETGSPKDREYAGFAKFFFVSQACPSTDKDDRFPKERSIYVDNGTCPDNKILINKKKTYINKEDGTRAFRIVYD
jgi:4-amino-4-deoxy-L-arabinose transferase-like glycosyltransferase